MRAVSKKAATLQAKEASGSEGAERKAVSQKDLTGGAALTWRFMRQEDGSWRVSFTTDVFAPAILTSRQLGAIGVDLNAGFLEAAEGDRFGNIVRVHQFKTPEPGLSSGQRDAARGEAVKAVIALCVASGRPLALEALDFQAKKQDLRVRSPGSKRKLSALPYQALKTLFCARAQDAASALNRWSITGGLYSANSGTSPKSPPQVPAQTRS